MARALSCVVWWIAGTLVAGMGRAEAARPVEELLPKTTAGFMAVANVEQLCQHWDRTQLGQLMADPVMKSFKESIQQQFEDRLSGLHERLGLKWEDLRKVPTGEVCMAAIRPGADQAAMAVVADVSGNLEAAEAMLARISEHLRQQGAKRIEQTVGKTTIIFFDIPAPQDDPKGRPQKAFYFLSGDVLAAADNLEVIREILGRLSGEKGESLAELPGFRRVMERCAEDAEGEVPQVRWFIHPLGYAEVMRARTPEEDRRKGKSLVEVMQNQGMEAVEGIGGYVDFAVDNYEILHRTAIDAPPPYRESMKMFFFPNKSEYAPQRWVPRDVAMYSSFYCDVLNGFDNFGPLVDELFGAPLYQFSAELKHQEDLDKGIVPEEFRQRFKKLRLPLASTATVVTKKPDSVWEILGSGIGDRGSGVGVQGSGDEATGDRSLVPGPSPPAPGPSPLAPGPQNPESRTLNPEPSTPSPDSRQQGRKQKYIVKKGGGMLRVYEEQTGVWDDVLEGLETEPDGPQINLRNELIKYLGQRVTVVTDYQLPITPTSERLLCAVETTDEAAIAKALEKIYANDPIAKRRVVDEYVIWEIVEETQPQVPKISVGRVPSLISGEEEEEEEEEQPRMFPHMAVSAAHGHLFVASHLDFLLKVLKPAGPRETLSLSIDYQVVAAAIKKLGFPEECAELFSRTDEAYRPTYELIRQGKMPISETLVGRTLNTVLGEGEGTLRQQRIDGSTLPEYDVVRRYLGPAGMVISSEPRGWFFKGFTLNKESQ